MLLASLEHADKLDYVNRLEIGILANWALHNWPAVGCGLRAGVEMGFRLAGVAARRCGWASTWACVMRGERVRSLDSDPGWYIARLQRA